MVSTRAYQEGATFLVDEVAADLFRRHLARSPIARDALIYMAYGEKQRAL
jgi:hypothetical protein